MLVPKLSYYQKAREPGPMEQVEIEWSRRNILKAIRATEVHMMISCIAMVILQSISVCSAGIAYHTNNSRATGYVRNLLGFPGFLVV